MTEVNGNIDQMEKTTGDQTDLSEGTEGVVGGVVGLFTGVFGGVKIGEARTIKAIAKAEGKTVEEIRKMIKPEKPKKGKLKFQWPVTREKVVSEPKSADNSANGNNVKDEDKNTSSAS